MRFLWRDDRYPLDTGTWRLLANLMAAVVVVSWGGKLGVGDEEMESVSTDSFQEVSRRRYVRLDLIFKGNV